MADMPTTKRRAPARAKNTAPAVVSPDAITPATTPRPRKAAASKPAASPASTKGKTMNDTIKQITDKAQADGKAAFDKMAAGTKAGFEKGKVALGDMTEFTKGNVEAMVESTRIAAKGFEAMAQQSAAYAKTSFDKGAAAAKAMAAVKSPTELLSLQGDYVRTAFDDFVAEASRSTEAAVKLAGDVARPLQNRVALAVEKVKAAA